LRRVHGGEPRHRHAAFGKAQLHGELVAGQFRAAFGDARQTEPLVDRGGGERRIGGDADDPVDFANLVVKALRRCRRFRGPVDIGDQNRIGEGKAGGSGVDVGHDDIKPHLLGPFGRFRGLDAARDDEQRLLVHQKYSPAVDVEGLRRDVAGSVGGEEHHRIGDFLRRAQPLQDDGFGRLLHRGVGHACRRHVGGDQTRRHRVGTHIVPSAEARDHLRQRDQSGF
jgi:hypothetical protein